MADSPAKEKGRGRVGSMLGDKDRHSGSRPSSSNEPPGRLKALLGSAIKNSRLDAHRKSHDETLKAQFSTVYMQHAPADEYSSSRPYDFDLEENLKAVSVELEGVDLSKLEERCEKASDGEKKDEAKQLTALPDDSLLVKEVAREFRTEKPTVSAEMLKEKNTPHVRTALELFARENWVRGVNKYGQLRSVESGKRFPVPERDPSDSPDVVKEKSGISKELMKEVTDQEQRKLREGWFNALAQRPPIFSCIEEEPERPVPFTLDEIYDPFPPAQSAQILIECTV